MSDRLRQILSLALPIIGGMVSQNVMNLVDTAMVGTLGDAALGAVGTASFAHFMCLAFIMGLSTGVQAMASRRVGEGRRQEAAIPLNGGLMVAAAVAIPLSVLLFFLAADLFALLNDDPAVQADGVPYFRARICAAVFVGMNFSFRGYWNGVGLSRLYLRTLLLMHPLNIGLNYVLIFGHLGAPALGAEGAGIGTAVATGFGTLTYVFLGFRHAWGSGFLKKAPARESLRDLIRVSLPAGAQQFLFASGMLMLFVVIGKVGTPEVAAANVLINLALVAILPGLGFGLASATLVGQALGRGDPDDAEQWGHEVLRVAMVVMGLLGLPMLFFPDRVLSVFLHDPQTLLLARLPLQVFAATISLDAMGFVMQHSLLGAGDSRRVFWVFLIMQWGLFLPAAFLVGPVLGGGLLAIWIAQVAYRIAQGGIFLILWRRGGWQNIPL
jgi:putative MATE family efflux protein